MPYLGVTPAAEFTSKDLNGEELILDADADTTITADTDDQIDIRIAGADDFSFKANTFEVQTGSNIDMNGTELILDANGNTSITADSDDQIDIKIAGADDFQFTANTFTAQSGSTIAAQALTATTITTTANPTFANTANNLEVGMDSNYSTILDAQVGNSEFFVLKTNKSFRFDTSSGSGKMNLAAEGLLSLSEDENSNMTTGLNINQGASDDEIFALKSSDVAHGLTARTETDTFMAVKKYHADQGGALILGFNESITSVTLRGEAVAETSTRSTAAEAPVRIDARVSGEFLSANNNIMNIEGVSGQTKFIFDSDGDFHADSSSTTFDSYDDAQLARTFDLSHNRGVITSKFDKFIAYNHEKLADLEIVGREEDGTPNHFINVTGMQRLHNGAIWQQYEKHENLLNAVYELAVEAVGEDKANEILDKNDVKLLSKNELLN